VKKIILLADDIISILGMGSHIGSEILYFFQEVVAEFLQKKVDAFLVGFFFSAMQNKT
jgi:hypothetical protein